jgi:UDP-2,3-diacylglucosamine pyrophosphatase LpxH
MALRKVKVIVSDFHLGRGRWLDDGSLNPLEQFIYDEKFIQLLDYYSHGEFRNSELELIFNGDFLNTIQVDYDEVLPEAITERGSLDKVRKIVQGHPEIFEALRKFLATPGHTLTYIYGNHEPSLLWPEVRDYLNKVLETDVKYPGFSYKLDGIYMEHGQQYQTVNRFDLNQLFLTSGLKEPIINLPWGSYFVIKYLNRLKLKRPHIDRVSPFGMYLLYALLFDTGFALSAIAKLVLFFLGRHLDWRPGQRNPLSTSWHIIRDISITPNLVVYARQILKRGPYHTVIFGHDHTAAFRRVGQGQLYVNTGTWNDVIHLDIANLGRQLRTTYAQIDYDHQSRPSVRLKIWKGTRPVEEDVIF